VNLQPPVFCFPDFLDYPESLLVIAFVEGQDCVAISARIEACSQICRMLRYTLRPDAVFERAVHFAGEARTKPHKHHLCSCVDEGHKAHFPIALSNIGLINTYGVNPNRLRASPADSRPRILIKAAARFSPTSNLIPFNNIAFLIVPSP
jgi:hypothetical protein